jgi:titin
MPNVPPRGIYGCLTTLGAFLPAKDVSAVKPGDTTYTPAQYVWTWCGPNDTGAWQVVWGRVVSPPVLPAAVYVNDVTNVAVTWTLPSPNVSNGWIVRRPDGSEVGRVAATTTQLTDQNPLPGTGAYTVAGFDSGGAESAAVATNSLSITLTPATATATLVGGDVKVDWTTGPQGQPDKWAVWNVTDNKWEATTVAAALRTFTVTGLATGKLYTFAVYPYINDVQATGKNTASVGVPAADPISVALAAINAPAVGAASADQIQLTWAAPSGTVTGYEVESSTNGTTWTASSDDATPVVFVSAVPLYARVRATSAGGSSGWVQKGPVSPFPDSPPAVPTSVVLTALSSPVSTLQLTWGAGAGATSYDAEYSTNNSTWTDSTDNTSPSLWSTTTATGYMRVRSVSAGGVSAWVVKGPVAAINDTTPPATPVITSFKPESSYGRMVVRFTTPNISDFGAYRVDYSTDGGAYTTGSWVNANGNTAYGVALGKTYVATDVAGVRVYYRDDALNVSAADTATYTLVASPKIVDATDSATWRGSAWRTDSTSGSTGVMHGRTTSGENYGCWFYGEALQDFVSTHTVVSASVNYARESSQGSGSAIQPGFWVHNYATQPAGSPVSSFTDGPVLGSGVARSGTTTGSVNLSAAQIAQLATYKGLGIYRSTSVTDDANAASFYMKLNPFSSSSGRVTLNHLG